MNMRQYFGAVLLLGSLGLGTPVHAKPRPAAMDRLYTLYTSTATPFYYKRAIAQILAPLNYPGISSKTWMQLRPQQRAAAARTLSAAHVDSAFVLHDVSVFPNPARGKQKPTIRIQLGLADSVDLFIYNKAGHLLKNAGLSEPQILSAATYRSKGPQYTYDYVWDAAGPGSYIVQIKAHKAGSGDIVTAKKFKVIK
jgi:hypothetical protein